MVLVSEIRDAVDWRDAAPGPSPFIAGVIAMVRRELAAEPVRAFARRGRLARIVSNARGHEGAREFVRAILSEVAQ
jgi:hypothetical protein